jgi:cobalt-zinc-cadmium efflux system outer membrane protein
VLQTEALVKIAQQDLEDARQLQAVIAKQTEGGKGSDAEKHRVRLLVLDATLALSGREQDAKNAKAKLRPLIGRTAADPDFEVVGTLDVTAVVPVPELKDAIALAEIHRPDLMSDRHTLARASASVHLEQRRAKPQVALTPGWSYQYQRNINGFRNGSMLDVGVQFSLPITDRNQGNIRKAQWQLAEAQYTNLANLADARAEVEVAVAAYDDAVDDITANNDPETLKGALALRRASDEDFAAGRRRLVEVLDARRVSSERQVRNIEFQATYWRTLNRLNTVVGLNAYDPATGAKTPVQYGKNKELEPPKK